MTSFHPALYLALNPELVHIVPPQHAHKHYIEHGQKEGRKIHIKQIYPDFRYNVYLSLHPDLMKLKMSEMDAQLHWLQKGRFEKRLYKPVMLKDHIILYTDHENKERCKEFGSWLDNIGVRYIIKEDTIMQTNHLYILFTLNNIKTYPFYTLLCLPDYKINVSVIDLAICICAPSTVVMKQTKKLFYLDDTYYSTEDLLKRMLVSIGFIELHDYHIPVERSTIYLIVSLEDKHMIPSHPEIQKVYSIKNNRGDDQTIRCLINQAKEEYLDYIMITKEQFIPTEHDRAIIQKTISFLDEMKIEWNIITNIEKSDDINNVIEIIQLDKDTEMIRLNRYVESNFLIVHKSLYDYILKWNDVISLNQHLKQNEIYQIAIKNIFVQSI